MVLAEHLDAICDRRPGMLPYGTVFGGFQIHTADGQSLAIPNSRARAILAILCTDTAKEVERSLLSDLLWSGRFPAHAKASLRQCLFELGKLLEPLGSDVLVVTRNTVGLNRAAFRTELDDLENALRHGDLGAAAQQLTEIGNAPLLDRVRAGDAFDNWLERRRADVERRLHSAVTQALEASDDAGCAQLLEAWKMRHPDDGAVPARTAPIGTTRLAVLPFCTLGPEETRDYFTDGMVDQLITVLGSVPQLQVMGRTSSFHFRDTKLALPEIASALHVSHLVEGSVQCTGARVRFHVHLIDGTTGFEIWGERYDGSLDNIFALQETVAQAVTRAVGGALDIALEEPQVRGMTSHKQAYDLFLQGRALTARVFGDGTLDTAVELLEQAVAIDPQFAEAWVALAEAHQLIAIYTPCLDRPAESGRMAECAQRAISINPDLGYAHALLGVHQWTQNDIVGALDLAYKAYDLEPENPAVCMRLGSFLLYCGRTSDAMRYVEAAIARDPVDGRKFNLRCVGRFNQGDTVGAIEAGRRMVDLGFPSLWLAVAIRATSQNDLAVEQYQRTRLLMNKVMFPPAGTGPMPPAMMDAFWQIASKGVCSGREEDEKAYGAMLDMLQVQLHDPADPSIVLPSIFMGHAERVFQAMSHAITPANTLTLASIWADVDPIRRVWQHPEFIPFAQRIGMAAAWDKYGWPDLLPPPSNLSRTN